MELGETAEKESGFRNSAKTWAQTLLLPVILLEPDFPHCKMRITLIHLAELL